MIFVTVGTHEQQFDRLVSKIDLLRQKEVIKEDVFIQIGYSSYLPKYCNWERIISYEKMEYYIKQSEIIITHGGPASFLMVLMNNKVPIVVPRSEKYEEHINNHQIDFVKFLSEKRNNIIPVFDIDKLDSILLDYENITKTVKVQNFKNNDCFNKSMNSLIRDLFKNETK